jgi:carbon monoxide dehydrogenase subunit G
VADPGDSLPAVVQPDPRWYERDGLVAAGVLLLLGLGAVDLGLVVSASGQTAIWLTLGGGALFAVLATVLVVYGSTVRGRLRRQLEPRAAVIFSTTIALAVALAIDIFATVYASDQPVFGWLILAGAAAWTLIWLLKPLRWVRATTQVVFTHDPSTVFGYLSDFRTQTEYMPGVVSVDKLTGGPIGVGSRFLTKMGPAEANFQAVDVMTVYERDRRYASTVEGAIQPIAGEATFEPIAEGTLGTFRTTARLGYSSTLLGMGLLKFQLVQQMRRRRRDAWSRANEILKDRETPPGR